MIFFQNRKSRNCVSANGTRQKYMGQRESTEPKQFENTHFTQNSQDKENFVPSRQSHEAQFSSVDPFKQQMRFLIEQNSDYFQSKVRITDKVRPNQYRFKIPTKTPQTIYKKNFNQKQKNLSVDNLILNRNNLSQTIKKKQSQEKLLFSTTYQNQFGIKKQNANSRKNSFFNARKSKQVKHETDNDVPRFLETQNKCFFLNWGGKNPTTSLKPSYQTVAVNFPLQNKTTYNNDFQGKTIPASKLIVPESSISRFTSPFMINKSSYSREFSRNEKRPQMQKSCKPQHQHIKSCSAFRGNTEYRSQFMKNQDPAQGFGYEMSKQDLQTLIMQL